ncbi:hypothetical protein PAHAL_3G058100 [Panicum hallii]|uniref:Uncharacterized protein n=1 Tax=Panicum hallii TaxID=206008 RepID=A0A2T8KH89_9POAL|nr:hypothetical protein PAHAL_3G058100 [Panicum hallii]
MRKICTTIRIQKLSVAHSQVGNVSACGGAKRKRFPVVSSAGRGPRRQPMRARLATPTNAADVEAMETALRSDFLDQAQPLGSGLTSVNQATSLIMAGSDAAASTAKGKVTRSAEVRHAGA